jgi:hypothetical protein
MFGLSFKNFGDIHDNVKIQTLRHVYVVSLYGAICQK